MRQGEGLTTAVAEKSGCGWAAVGFKSLNFFATFSVEALRILWTCT